jgi:hypothetical protein
VMVGTAMSAPAVAGLNPDVIIRVYPIYGWHHLNLHHHENLKSHTICFMGWVLKNQCSFVNMKPVQSIQHFRVPACRICLLNWILMKRIYILVWPLIVF